MVKMDVTTSCHQVVDKIVKKQGTSGAIYVPIAWEGKKVRVLLLDTLDGEE
jgi:putative transposon-encoded protein